MDTRFLEQFYENIILPLYSKSVTFKDITWKDHGKLGPDSWAHYFDNLDGREYILLYEDFPGNSPFDDNLSHEVVRFKDQSSLQLSINDTQQIENVTGYFTLYQEKIHQQ